MPKHYHISSISDSASSQQQQSQSHPHYHPMHSPLIHTNKHPILHQISNHLNEKIHREREKALSSGTPGKSRDATLHISDEVIIREMTRLMFVDEENREEHVKMPVFAVTASGKKNQKDEQNNEEKDAPQEQDSSPLPDVSIDDYAKQLLIHAINEEERVTRLHHATQDVDSDVEGDKNSADAEASSTSPQQNSASPGTTTDGAPPPQMDELDSLVSPLLKSTPHTHSTPHPQLLLFQQIYFHNQALNIINRKLNSTVMENYSQYMSAMTEIQNIGMDITTTSVLCRNSRTKLKQIREREVMGSLKVIEKSKQKRELEQMLEHLYQIRTLLKESEKIDPLLDHREFPDAIQTLLRCGKLLHSNDELQKFSSIPHLSQSLHDKWDVIAEKVSSALKHVCDQFDANEYEKILIANKMLDGAQFQAEVTQNYTASISKKLQNTARSYAYKRAQFEVENLSKLHFNDLCKYIHSDDVLSCCLQVFSVLSDVLFNYNAMFLWHKKQEAQRRLLKTNGGSSSDASTNQNTKTNDNKRRGSTDSISSTQTHKEPAPNVLDYDFSAETIFLDNFRGQIWETIQSNLSTFLASVQFEEFKPDRFLQVYHGVNLFCILGHQFAGGKSFQLKKTLAEQTKNYFLKYHRRVVLENMRIVMDNEHCQRLELNLKLAHMNISKKDWSAVHDQIRRVKNFLVTPSNHDEEDSKMNLPDELENNIFREATVKGQFNIFSLEKSDFAASLDEYSDEEESDEDDTDELQTNDHLSESKIAEFFGDDMPATSETSTAGSRKSSKRASKRKHENAYTVLNSTHTILKQIPFYMHAIQVFDLVRLELFFCLTSIFRFYLYAMHSFFANFNQKELLHPENDTDIPTELEQVFTTIRRTLDKCNAEVDPQNPFPLPILQLSDSVYHAPMNGIVPRSNGAESLMFLKDVVEHLEPQLKPIMPKNKVDFVNAFVMEYQESTVAVRRTIYDRLVTHAINMESYPSKIASCKFVVNQLREANPYVQQFLSDTKRYFDQVSRRENELPPGSIRELWSSATRQLMDAMVEGFSRVKKCNNEGRALMQMDFNALQGGLNDISSYEIAGLQKVKNYIQGYYYQENDILDWIKSAKNDYTYKQIEALINAGCGANMKKKAKADLMTSVENIVDKGKEKNSSRWTLRLDFRKHASSPSVQK
mmetsp:Transcript_9274/g.34312  ORF Transcript_9274/g.34312 Transcript_9274/m.34312 type:complete len:1168 (-) Transcript_9274:28-3531(-)